jgi:signal transduction histidine kinase
MNAANRRIWGWEKTGDEPPESNFPCTIFAITRLSFNKADPGIGLPFIFSRKFFRMESPQIINQVLQSSRVRQLVRAMTRAFNWKNTPLVGLVSYLRWAIPIAVSFVGIAYILFEQIVLQNHALDELSVIRSVLVIGLAGPALVWLTLTWAARAAVAEADAQKQLALRNQEARRRAVHLQTASLIGQRMSALLDLNSLLTEIVRLIRAKFGYYHAHLFLVDDETQEIALTEASGAQADAIKARGLRLKIGAEGITGSVAHTGRTLLCNDVSQEPRYHSAELLPEAKSELAVPLRVGKRIVGVLDVQSDRLNGFDNEDVIVLEILGNQIGIAIENARLFQETKRRYEAMVALHETSLDMIAQLDMDAVLQALMRRGTQLVGAQGGTIYLNDSEPGIIRNIANFNTSRDWRGITMRHGEGVAGRVVATGEPLIVNDYDHWAGKSDAFVGDPQSRVIGAPIKWRDQTIGVLLILNDQTMRAFDHADLWLLRQFADLASIAIENAKLHTQVKNFSQELERNVAERTRELSDAKEEIAIKAAQLRSLLSKTIKIQEEERARIAREMHDGVVQLITAARYELRAARVVGGATISRAAHEKLDAAREVLEETEREIRHAIYDLHSPLLDAIGLVPALEKYASRYQELAGIACVITVAGAPCRLPDVLELAVFRMVEEALQNVASHARAHNTAVALNFESAQLEIIAQDDGCGFDFRQWMNSRNGNHLGLIGMQERVASLGGTMQVWSEPGQGTRVHFYLPITREMG